MPKEEILNVISEYREFLLKWQNEILSNVRDLTTNDNIKNEEKEQLIQNTPSLDSDEEKFQQSMDSANTEKIEGFLWYIDNQINMLNTCYDPVSQEMKIYTDSHVYDDGKADHYMSYHRRKFLSKIAEVSKTDAKILNFSEEYPDESFILEYIKNNKDLLVLKISGDYFFSDFIEDTSFYSAINTANNLFYIHVSIWKEGSHLDMALVEKKLKSKINSQRPLVISWNYEDVHTMLFKGKNNDIFYLNNEDSAKNIELAMKKAFDEETFQEKLSDKVTFRLPLLCDALESKIIGHFKDEDKNLLDATIYHDKEFEGWRLLDYAIFHDDILTTRFLMLKGTDLFYTNSLRNRPLEIAAEYASVSVLMALLEVNQVSTEINLRQNNREALYLTNSDGHTPLMIAAKRGKLENVKFLLKCTIERCQLDDMQKTMNVAWDNQRYDCVLYLLKQDFPFPTNFDLLTLVTNTEDVLELKKFADKQIEFHSVIKNGNITLLIELISENKSAGYGFNIPNESALNTALSNRQYAAYAYLKIRGFKGTLQENLEDRVLYLNEEEKTKLNKSLISYFHRPSQSLVFYLLSKSRTLQHESRYFDTIKFLYEQLSQIPSILPVLSVIEHYNGYIDIIFDFNSSCTIDLDVTSDEQTKGRCSYEDGRIFIAAKLSTDELLGNMAHEFTHLAMYILYKNNCKPYAPNDVMNQDKYKDIVDVYDKLDRSSMNVIITRSFTAYKDKNALEAELIVRIPHILAKYGEEAGMVIVKTQITGLLTYYEQTVLLACNVFINKSKNLNADGSTLESRTSNNQYSFWRNLLSTTTPAVLPITEVKKDASLTFGCIK
jgi:hypothetical protein